MAEKLEMMSEDIIQDNIEYIASKFPNALKETKDENGKLVKRIDFDVLKQELSNVVIDDKKERYQMTWPDKKKSILLANSRINGTLRPVKEKSVDFDNTQNLYIEGDNLDVLKLLRETYLGKVKMIYIDPPYNTGNDFVYNDDFAQSSDEYLNNSGQFDDQGNRMVTNSESNGRFHTDWLNMMYPRLKVARDLLTDDGVIFISIDDNEVDNLRKICDEVFGDENRLSSQHIQVRYGQKSLNEKKEFQELIETVFIYCKSKVDIKDINRPHEDYDLSSFNSEFEEIGPFVEEIIGGKKVHIFKDGTYKLIKHSEGKIGYLKGTWASGSVVKGNASGKYFENFLKPRKNIDGLRTLYKVYGIGEDGLGYRYFTGPQKEEATQGLFYSGVPLVRVEEIKNGSSVKYKPILNFYDFSGDFGNIKNEGGIGFNSGKKPIKMLEQFMNYFSSNDCIVMDFFSGSASTAHAVMDLNLKDSGHRKFIMVQIPENCEGNSEAQKINAKTICDIGEERIRRAGKKIKEENPMFAGDLDTGFRVLKLDSSNMNDVYYNPNAMTQSLLDEIVDNIKPDRTPLDLLFQVMLELGIELSAKITEKEINGKKYYQVNENDIVACFDDNLDNDLLTKIAKLQPLYAVFKDSSFATDSVGINNEQIFKTYSPGTKIKVL